MAGERDIEPLGKDLWNKSYYPTGPDAAALFKDWYIVDAEGQTLGRLAVLVANHLRCASDAPSDRLAVGARLGD